MNLSERIADWLVQQGITQVFTVTGGGSMYLNQALASHPGLTCTFMHHEQACAMAAEGYARISGRPAVLMVTTGPGGINALNGVFGAYTDSIPMLVISGQVKRATCLDYTAVPGLRQLGDQEGPVIHMARPITKMAQSIGSPQELMEHLPKALIAATTGRPGPVWIDIPLDVQSAVCDPIASISIPEPEASGELTSQCQLIAQHLAQAHRPLIMVGTGVRLARAEQALLAFAERHGIPVCTAWTHDTIPSDHPLFAGRPGTIGTRAGNFCTQSADVVLVIGSRLNIRQVSYNWDSFAKEAWIAQVDIDPAEFAKPMVKPALAVQADAKVFLQALSQACDAGLPSFAAWSTWCQQIRSRYGLQAPVSNGPSIHPYALVERVCAQLRDDDILVCGNASACILPFQVAKLGVNNRMFSNSGSASMGYDLPAALGAAIAAPDRRVICFAGDGSLQMNIQELQTLKTLGLNVIVVVIDNAGYLSIRQTHENFFGRVVGATPASGVEFPDFARVAECYGVRARQLEASEQLTLLDAAMQLDGPMLIHVKVDPEPGFAPRIKSRALPEGGFATPELDDMFPFLPSSELTAVRAEAKLIHHDPVHPQKSMSTSKET
jgi:acetolactate synthase-1/2/3 large subunit